MFLLSDHETFPLINLCKILPYDGGEGCLTKKKKKRQRGGKGAFSQDNTMPHLTPVSLFLWPEPTHASYRGTKVPGNIINKGQFGFLAEIQGVFLEMFMEFGILTCVPHTASPWEDAQEAYELCFYFIES